MVYLAQYDKKGTVIGFKGEDERSYPLSYEAELKKIGTVIYKSQAELDTMLEDVRVLSITAEADVIIYTKYPQTKQNKLSSTAIALLDIRMARVLTADEESLLQSCRDVNIWVTAIRDIENTAITDGTLLADVVWE